MARFTFHPAAISRLFLPGLILIAVVFVYARMNGITGRTLLNGSGCTCHGSSSTDVTVVINGPDDLETGQTATYTATISGGAGSAAGINIAAAGATLTPVSDNLQKFGNELTHSSPVAFSGNSVNFEFTVTAPEEDGELTLYATGNSVNGNSGTSGDTWNHASNKPVTISAANSLFDQDPSASPLHFDLKQNYPNPFNPVTTIPFALDKRGYVSLKVYDVLGREIATVIDGIKDAGIYYITFDARNLNSGTYWYKLKSESGLLTRKMSVVK